MSDQVPWTLTSYIQAQAHPYDRYFYDPVTKAYTVDRFLEDLKIRYGGIDSVLMWSVYTQIGVDDRNQFDMWRSMPGGLEGVANLTAQLHSHGVKMLWPNKPWDLGTRYEPAGRPGLSDTDAKVYATLLKQTDGDGLNGDTMDSFSKEFYAESARLGHPIALEPENGVEDEALDWSTINWGYWSYPKAPVVDRFKFVTEGRFLTNVYNRWAKDKTNDLQSAWFNGDGYEGWENVWGVWNGITHYDGEAICRVGTMLRYFGKEGFLASPDWEPYAREVWQADVYSSKFPLKERGQSVWTIVNRKNSYSWFSCTQLRLVLGTQLRLLLRVWHSRRRRVRGLPCHHARAHRQAPGQLRPHLEVPAPDAGGDPSDGPCHRGARRHRPCASGGELPVRGERRGDQGRRRTWGRRAVSLGRAPAEVSQPDPRRGPILPG